VRAISAKPARPVGRIVNPPATTLQPTELALLVIDANGTVRAANDFAGKLWQTKPADLAGQPLLSLFAFDNSAYSPGRQTSRWEALIATALSRPLRLLAQPFEPVAAVPVVIELQAAHGPDTVFFARIEPAASTGEVGATAIATAPVVNFDPNAAQPHPSQPQPSDARPPAVDGAGLLAALGPLGFFDLDLQTGRLISSPAWKRMLGYETDASPETHETWRALIHPDDTAALPDQIAKPPLTGHREFSFECRLRHRLGHYIWVHSSGIQLFGPDRSLIRVLGLNVDIHERKEIEELALTSEDRIARLSETGALALFDLDFASNQHWFSPAFTALIGEGRATPPSLETLLDVLPAHAKESGLEAFFSSFSTGEPFASLAIKLRLANAREVTALLGVHRQWSRKRTLNRVVGFIHNVPENTNPLSGALINGVLDSLNEAVIVADAQGQVIYLNSNASQLTGWSSSAAHAVKLTDVFKLVRADNGRPDDDALDLVLAAGAAPRLHAEHALVAASGGKPRSITWSPRLVTSTAGVIEGLVVVFRDPEAMTLSPEERIRANRFESLGQLASGISHDFNNLLTTILGGISTAKDNRDYTKLADAESACLAAKTLTRQLLTVAKGGSSSDQQIVAPGDILADAVRISTPGSTAIVSVNVADDTAPIQVDRGQIIQVFQNLIINALQAMPDLGKGRVQLLAFNVRLETNAVPPLPAGDYVQFEVQDNGSGIPAEHLGKIFESYYTTKKHGTGLGLATVRSIVLQHGGLITVTSIEGSGTTFSLYFPRAERPVVAVTRTVPSLRFGTGRILFLDDDPKIGELTGSMLASLDYTYDVVRTGEDALTFYRRYLNIGRPYDAVILDLNVIGGMGGEECFKQIRALHPEVRAIANSGYDNEEMIRRCHSMGFAAYLTKPYRVGDLARILKVALGKA
jgi:two-component system cell cycle sensor histidine kinase/response regulator CckA